MRWSLAPVTLLIVLLTPGQGRAASGAVWDTQAAKPSENAGRIGQYHCTTSRQGYNYWVYAPKSYSESNPAGLHLFFHGQGSQGSAQSFGRWALHFCDKFNLVGVNMEYMDGDNKKDTAGKVLSAEEAVAQVMADYKIVRGRGAVGSFSGGGLPHGRLHSQYAGDKTPRFSWPFSHSSLYGSNFWKSATGTHTMSWFIGLGTGEWDVGKPTLGTTQQRRAGELYGVALRGGCPDVDFKIIKGKGHDIADADVAASSAGFRRSDIMLAPFVYGGDYPERELAGIVSAANSRQLGSAARLLGQVLRSKSLDADTKKKAEDLDRLISARIGEMLRLLQELSETDFVLFAYYAQQASRQLTGHPAQKDVRSLFTKMASASDSRRADAAFQLFARSFSSFFGQAVLHANAIPILVEIRRYSGEQSLVYRLSDEYLLLADPEELKKYQEALPQTAAAPKK
ncbi:MAG: hypothetical protein JW909_05325 [Planctomycetes bacterium]|nr:hypothetical protein [Planctomycetota bacterium]